MISTPSVAADTSRALDTESATWLAGCSGDDILSRLGAALYPTVTWYLHPCRMRRTTRDREILDVARNPRSAGA
jgi:hypothetical protein